MSQLELAVAADFWGESAAPAVEPEVVPVEVTTTCREDGRGACRASDPDTGAALGGCLGSGLTQLIPDFPVSPALFAYAGMAAMVGGTTGAAVTATIMVFEMTRDYTAILPVILTVVLACAVRQWLSPATIYTLKLLRRGHVVPQGLQAWMGELRSKDVMTLDFLLLSEDEAKDANRVRTAHLRGQVVVVKGKDHEVSDVIDVGFPFDSREPGLSPSPASHVTVAPDHRFHEVLRALDQAEARVALVTRVAVATGQQEVLGVITASQIFKVACATAKLTG